MNIKTTAIKILLSKTFLSASMLISIQRKKSYAGSLLTFNLRMFFMRVEELKKK